MPEPRPPTIRPFTEADRPFFRQLMARLVPESSPSPRAPGALAAYLDRRATGETPGPANSVVMIAADAENHEQLGLIAYVVDQEHFAGHPRLYVDLLAVTETAAGRGVGYALMRHAENWGVAHGCHELALDVFASNDTALAFYQRFGLAPDHLRLSKALPAATGSTPPASTN